MQTKQPQTPQHPAYAKDLLLLFSVPLAIAALAAALVYIPRLAANPTYDFIYADCPEYDCRNSYELGADGHIKETTEKTDVYYGRAAQLRYYDASANATRSLSYEEAKKYSLLNSSRSPEGYTLAHNYEDGGFLFWGGGKQNWQLENGWKKQPVVLNNNETYYANNLIFLGWMPR